MKSKRLIVRISAVVVIIAAVLCISKLLSNILTAKLISAIDETRERISHTWFPSPEERVLNTVKQYYPEAVLLNHKKYCIDTYDVPEDEITNIKYVYTFCNKDIEFNVYYETWHSWGWKLPHIEIEYADVLSEYLMTCLPENLSEKFNEGIMENRGVQYGRGRSDTYSVDYLVYVYHVRSDEELHDAAVSFESLYEFMKPYLPYSDSVMPRFWVDYQEFEYSFCINDETEIYSGADNIDWQEIEKRLYEEYERLNIKEQ